MHNKVRTCVEILLQRVLGHPPFFFFRLPSNAFPDIGSVGRIVPIFFFRLPSNAFPDIGSVGQIEQKIMNILGIVGLVAQHHSCGARKTTRREPKINMAETLLDVIAKLRQCGEKGSTTETPM